MAKLTGKKLMELLEKAGKFATTPMKPKALAPLRERAEKTPIMPLVKGFTPKSMMDWGAPLEKEAGSVPAAVKAGVPVAQVPEVVGAVVRSAGRTLGVQPSPLDILMMMGVVKGMKGKSLRISDKEQPFMSVREKALAGQRKLPVGEERAAHFLETETKMKSLTNELSKIPVSQQHAGNPKFMRLKTELGKAYSDWTHSQFGLPMKSDVGMPPGMKAVGRPEHQQAIERALNAGNIKEAQSIINKMSPKDIYKEPMQDLINRKLRELIAEKLQKPGGMNKAIMALQMKPGALEALNKLMLESSTKVRK